MLKVHASVTRRADIVSAPRMSQMSLLLFIYFFYYNIKD